LSVDDAYCSLSL
jgi:hypothetical protein